MSYGKSTVSSVYDCRAAEYAGGNQSFQHRHDLMCMLAGVGFPANGGPATGLAEHHDHFPMAGGPVDSGVLSLTGGPRRSDGPGAAARVAPRSGTQECARASPMAPCGSLQLFFAPRNVRGLHLAPMASQLCKGIALVDSCMST